MIPGQSATDAFLGPDLPLTLFKLTARFSGKLLLPLRYAQWNPFTQLFISGDISFNHPLRIMFLPGFFHNPLDLPFPDLRGMPVELNGPGETVPEPARIIISKKKTLPEPCGAPLSLRVSSWILS